MREFFGGLSKKLGRCSQRSDQRESVMLHKRARVPIPATFFVGAVSV